MTEEITAVSGDRTGQVKRQLSFEDSELLSQKRLKDMETKLKADFQDQLALQLDALHQKVSKKGEEKLLAETNAHKREVQEKAQADLAQKKLELEEKAQQHEEKVKNEALQEVEKMRKELLDQAQQQYDQMKADMEKQVRAELEEAERNNREKYRPEEKEDKEPTEEVPSDNEEWDFKKKTILTACSI